jgi:hypothetical protein
MIVPQPCFKEAATNLKHIQMLAVFILPMSPCGNKATPASNAAFQVRLAFQ